MADRAAVGAVQLQIGVTGVARRRQTETVQPEHLAHALHQGRCDMAGQDQISPHAVAFAQGFPRRLDQAQGDHRRSVSGQAQAGNDLIAGVDRRLVELHQGSEPAAEQGGIAIVGDTVTEIAPQDPAVFVDDIGAVVGIGIVRHHAPAFIGP